MSEKNINYRQSLHNHRRIFRLNVIKLQIHVKRNYSHKCSNIIFFWNIVEILDFGYNFNEFYNHVSLQFDLSYFR